MPFAAGIFRATVVLPAECDDWTPERRSAVLIHELGHAARRDLLGHTRGRIACALYWFHPLVWSAARQLRADRNSAVTTYRQAMRELSLGARVPDSRPARIPGRYGCA